MTDPARNAALWYAPDGYDPAAKGINGRRVAGESFLRGFLRHADIAEAVLLTGNPAEAEPVRALAESLRPGLPLRIVSSQQPGGIAPIRTLYYPSPNFAPEAWRRAPYGPGAWSLSGVTHTTSTAAVMEGWLNLRVAPVKPWDAVICTSRAVRASVDYQMDLIDAHLASHLGARPGPRPLLPVIPLGIDCAAFAPDPAAGAALRARLGAAPQDVVFTTIARLTPHEKFDPLPVYLAMAEAQRRLPPGQRLHVVFCGLFRDDYSRRVFEAGAAALMPGVGFALTDGADPHERSAALSGADVFLFPIDNIQETFGLAPVEAMAAGLPLLVSDWDGMKDTVTPDVGFRVTSRMLGPQALAPEALRYRGGVDNYVQYCAATSAMTELDIGEMVTRILDLALNPGLRRRMGQAGAARARGVYDWAQVIPRMQDLWAEQEALRRAGAASAPRYPAHALPVAPSPTALFAAWPSEVADLATPRFAARDLSGRADLEATLTARDYGGVKRMFAAPAQIAALLRAVTEAGPPGTSRDALAAQLRLAPASVERILIWLLKYDFIRRV
ncbi:glycosyltransferase family 4 protein [Tabrizicola fusiformis]|uniref:glycosyltransferase family 4 protein n=1 Tax=Tabrizicola sp. SY72 TaxID=2741673 RepID=UPI0015737AFA|nr:glycosyltransferase family 4 protein [Tabrizicola sp. SY72]NTT85394.1 glycosyltransferase family 4 protein [Tabrizicola sp. SY72]